MNYFQNNSTNNFQPLMQRSTVNRFIQPQLICVDQSSMNITATALNAIKTSTSQKFQRGSRQYIIKFRNSNTSANSSSQSPQKTKKGVNNQMMCLHLEDPYLKENKNIAEHSVKISKIVNKVISPSSSLSTQSSNKNDQGPTDKEDDSPLRTNKSSKQNDNRANVLVNYSQISINNLSTTVMNLADSSFKTKQKNCISTYQQQENSLRISVPSELGKLSKQDERKQQQESINHFMMQSENKQIEKGIIRNFNKLLNTASSLNGYNSKIVINSKKQNIQQNIEEIDPLQTTNRVFRNRDGSAPPLQDIALNAKVPESTQTNHMKISFHQPNGVIQKRHSVIRLSDPQTLALIQSSEKNSNSNNKDVSNTPETTQQQMAQQQQDLKLMSSTLQQIKLDEIIKKQISMKQSKKNTSFLGTKRKKLKKSKNINDVNENVNSIKAAVMLQNQFSSAVGGEKQCELQYDQDFQNLADQLENQQLLQKIDGNEFMFDEDNAFSEELNEYEEDLEEQSRDFLQTLQRQSKKQSKANNSVILPSLVQIGSNNQMEEQIEMTFKSKELESLNLTAKSVCIFDADKGKAILSLKGKKSREVASLTKIMTCYIICHAITKKKIKQADQIKVSRAAASMIGTSAYLRFGDQLSVWDLLHGLMLPSGNDAAFALAEFMGRLLFFEDEDYKKQLQQNPSSFENCKTKDAIKCFLQEMNSVAKDLKLSNTKYSNPHGLVNKSNRSSALDICKLSAHCMAKSALFRQIVKTKQYTCQIRNKQGALRISTWENTNKCLLRYNTICDGVKTGVTCTAGPCLTTSWRVKDRHFIITLLKCDSLEQRYSESQRVFAWLCEKLNIELTAEEKMPYEKIKLLYKRGSVESLHSMKNSSTNSSISLKQKPNIPSSEKQDSSQIYDNLKILTSYPELDNKSKSSFPTSFNH